MRSYIFNFSAQKIEKLGIKGTPVIILNYLDQFFKSGNADIKQYQDKNYFWIEAAKVVADLPFLDIKNQRVRQYIDSLCEIGVLEKYPATAESYSKTKMYIHINYNMLVDQIDGELTQIVGKDTSLPFYISPGINYYSVINYNAFNFVYESPAIQSVIIEANKNKFSKLLYAYLQQLLSPVVFESLSKHCTISTQSNTIKLSFKSTAVIIESIVYIVEQAVVGAYTSLLISQNFAKNKTSTTKINDSNRAILNQISL